VGGDGSDGNNDGNSNREMGIAIGRVYGDEGKIGE